MHTLESRRLLAGTAVLSNGTLTITGTDNYDQLAVYVESNQLVVTGTYKNKETFTGVKRIKINALGGHDMVEISPRITVPASIDGGTGNDAIVGGSGDDTLAGANGNDIIYGGAGNDVLRGGNDADTLRGNGGTDALLGENGDDRLVADAGRTLTATGEYDWEKLPNPDYLDGAGGNDTIDYSGVHFTDSNLGYQFDLRAVRSQGSGSYSDITTGGVTDQNAGVLIARLSNYESLIGTGYYDNFIIDTSVDRTGTGTGVRKSLRVDGFNNNDSFHYSADDFSAGVALLDVTLAGGRGADSFYFNDEANNRPARIEGGAGDDNVDVYGTVENATLANIDLGAGSGDSLIIDNYNGGDYTMHAGLEKLQVLSAAGNAQNKRITGNASDNRIEVPTSLNVSGLGGDDTIIGGFDVLAGDGNDDVSASLGIIDLGAGDDIFTAVREGFAPNEIPLIVRGGAGNDYIDLDGGLLTGRSRASIFGDAGNDTIYGSAGNDSIDLGSGNNWVEAGDGNDYINAANGMKDVIDGGRGNTGASRDVDLDILINSSPASHNN